MKAIRAAGVDIGTNSVRLLVAEVSGAAAALEIRTVHRLMNITRLGEGVDETGRLGEEAMRRTAEVLRGYRDLMNAEEVKACEVAATSAAREACNAGDFMRMVEEIIEVRPRVLSGREEAQLSFLGSTYDLGDLCPLHQPVLVVDIGGGSTEMIVGRDGGIVEELSLDVGCVRMSERFLAGDPIRAEALREMEDYIASVLSPHARRLTAFSPGLVVGLAGTVTTLSGIRQGLEEYDGGAVHHSWLSREEIAEIYGFLHSLPLEERREFMHLEPGRADVIVGGTAVLLVFLRESGLERLLVSEKDILDGLAITAACGSGA